jgi:hypothetical protein
VTDVPLPHVVIPGIAAFARGGLPEPATTDDGNQWTDGCCWLFCGQQRTRVLWVGPAMVAGAQAPMYACGPCIRELQERVWQALLAADDPGPQAPVTSSPAKRHGAKHRRTRG